MLDIPSNSLIVGHAFQWCTVTHFSTVRLNNSSTSGGCYPVVVFLKHYTDGWGGCSIGIASALFLAEFVQANSPGKRFLILAYVTSLAIRFDEHCYCVPEANFVDLVLNEAWKGERLVSFRYLPFNPRADKCEIFVFSII